MRRLICNVVSVLHSAIRLFIMKLLHGAKIRASFVERISPNVVVEIAGNGKLFLGNRVRIHSGTKIKVRNSGELFIGSNTKINYNCIIVCRDKISIGSCVEFGPSVYIYDHDHDYRKGIENDGFISQPITIGNNVWIGAGSIILRGSTIGNNCVIGAGSIIKGEFSDNSVIIQSRKTEIKKYEKNQ